MNEANGDTNDDSGSVSDETALANTPKKTQAQVVYKTSIFKRC